VAGHLDLIDEVVLVHADVAPVPARSARKPTVGSTNAGSNSSGHKVA
jgi:hypothetical protein